MTTNGPGSAQSSLAIAEGSQYCTFEVVDLLVGIEVSDVQEVLPDQAMTPVPLAPEGVLGLINLRGQIVTAVDLRSRLGLPVRPPGVRAMNAVVRRHGEVISLVVDRTRDVIVPPPEAFAPVPPTVGPRIRQMTTGTFRLDAQLLLVLDIDAVMRVQPDNVGSYRYPDWVSGLDLEEVFHRNGG
jgi:purine-binding chemotaxis protein CheW